MDTVELMDAITNAGPHRALNVLIVGLHTTNIEMLL